MQLILPGNRVKEADLTAIGSAGRLGLWLIRDVKPTATFVSPGVHGAHLDETAEPREVGRGGVVRAWGGRGASYRSAIPRSSTASWSLSGAFETPGQPIR